MAYEQIENKKFLDWVGTSYLWSKIKDRYDSKLDEVTAKDASINVTNNNQIQVVVSADAGNLLQLKNNGLYVQSPASPDTYAIVKNENASDYAAVYQLMKYANGAGAGTQVGVDINIPKDMVVSSGAVVTKEETGVWGAAGTYIELTLANATNDKLYIPVDGLIEYVTSGSVAGDTIMVAIDSNHKITATITDGTIPLTKLDASTQAMIQAGNTAIQDVSEGSINGTINVDGVDVPVHGLGTAAYTNATAYDAAGAAAAVLGANTDTAATATVYGVKQYASDVYSAILPLSDSDIDSAIAAANT